VRQRHLAIPALVAATFIWGATYVVTKGALEDIGPFTILVLRFGVGWLALWAVAGRRGYSPAMSLQPRFILFGLSGIVLHNGLETLGLVFTSAASAVLVIASAPAVTVAMSSIFLRERIGRVQAVGIALSIAGVALVSGNAASGDPSKVILGNALVFAGVVAWGIYTVQGKKLTTGHSGLVATAAGAGGALLFLIPLSLGEMVVQGLPTFTPGALASVAYLGLCASAIAYGLWNYALEKVDASLAAPFVNLVPVVGLAFAIALGESTTLLQIAGGGVVGIGVWLSTRARRRTGAREERMPYARGETKKPVTGRGPNPQTAYAYQRAQFARRRAVPAPAEKEKGATPRPPLD
jgi:drug/metabolite transporter (DMT)-like permease